jgi:CheY-like chemotaxis protein
MMRIQAEGKGLQFIAERQPDLPQLIRSDERKLRQVLLNLLSNAVKFTNEGSVTLRVKELPPTESGDIRLHFEIEDTGSGIAPDEMEKLFEPFMQTTSGQRVNGGTGLGIPISQEFVRLMGGELTVTNQPGRGTSFGFEMQAEVPEQIELEEGKPHQQVTSLSPGQRAPDGEPYRILVVDDREGGRIVLSKLLKMVGFTVQVAANGQEAIEQFEQWQPHLIWMDMRMPLMDGMEATRRIKATERGSETIIVALTASIVEEERQQILDAGCDDFIRKPFKESAIFETLTKHLGVTYLYVDHEEEASEAPALPNSLTSEDLANLPSELLSALHEDAMIGHVSGLEATIAQIANFDKQVADNLLKMTQYYDYLGILALLPKAGNET